MITNRKSKNIKLNQLNDDDDDDAVQSKCSMRARRLTAFHTDRSWTRCAAEAASSSLETAQVPQSRRRRRDGSAAVECPGVTTTT